VVFEYYGGQVGASWAGICGTWWLSSTPLVPAFKVWVEVFEAQRQEDTGHEGNGNGSCAVGLRMIAHRHRVIEFVSLLTHF
jgi:hypothetical protein